MPQQDKLSPGIQVFQGSRPQLDVFAANADNGCCDDATQVDHDKLANRVRFDNGLAHLNPLGGVERFAFPFGNGFANTRNKIINGINDNGVGFNISVIAVPTFAWVTGIGIHVEAEESGLTFDVVTRNGLVLPGTGETCGCVKTVNTDVDGCDVTHTASDGDATSFEGIGAMDDHAFVDIFGRAPICCDGIFASEADEIALKVASMPGSGTVNGEFAISVSVAYEVIHRAEA